ncbi:hypothetical protein V493_07608, partial [Pseudogymnoascus sp. VKM F-4281 (FW-2241)]
EAEIWELGARYISQPVHESEKALPGLDFITIQNEKGGLGGIKKVPQQQMERLLSGIPDAPIVASFILSHLPEEHHALLLCTTIFAEENDRVWCGHVLFGEWSREERVAFACKFSRLVPGFLKISSVLQKWRGLLEDWFFMVHTSAPMGLVWKPIFCMKAQDTKG